MTPLNDLRHEYLNIREQMRDKAEAICLGPAFKQTRAGEGPVGDIGLREARFRIAGLHHGDVLHGTLCGLRHRNHAGHTGGATCLATRRAGRAGNGIRDDAAHRIIGPTRTARADAEELWRLRCGNAR